MNFQRFSEDLDNESKKEEAKDLSNKIKGDLDSLNERNIIGNSN